MLMKIHQCKFTDQRFNSITQGKLTKNSFRSEFWKEVNKNSYFWLLLELQLDPMPKKRKLASFFLCVRV